jgi:hypothetical protein
MDGEGLPENGKSLQVKSRTINSGEGITDITPVTENVYEVKPITQEELLGINIKGPVKIGG